jgi:hypothetical protein
MKKRLKRSPRPADSLMVAYAQPPPGPTLSFDVQ